MKRAEYQVLRVKPDNLESALNEMDLQGWQVHSMHAARFSGRQWFYRQTLDVYEYHLVLHRAVNQ